MRGARAGRDGSIVLGDVIVGVEDRTIESSEDLFQALEGYRAGQVVTVKVVRYEGGQPQTRELSVELQKLK